MEDQIELHFPRMASIPHATDITLQKPLPHNPEAETAVLGAILLNNTLFDQAAEKLIASDFHLTAHQHIFSKMAQLSALTRPIDAVTLREELVRDNLLEEIGGASYLASLMDGAFRMSNIEQYTRIVKEKAILRQLIHSANDILVRSFSNEEEASDLLEAAEKAIFELGQEKIQVGFAQLEQLLPDTYKHLEQLNRQQELITGIATGFTQLDQLMSGMQPADLIILAARPGCGKTSLALNISQHAAIGQKKTVGIFSLEMSSQQVVTRLLCSEARVDSHRVRTGRLAKRDWAELTKAMSRLSHARVFIDDSASLSIMEMRSKARRLKSEHDLDLLIVDYLQLMSGKGNDGQRFESREKEIAAISRSLKAMAKEIKVPVLALSQLSRAPEQRRGNHRPQLSDLRESGSIEQDADVVLFIFREDMYKKAEDRDEDSGVATIIIGKQRNGPTGEVKLAFIEEWTKFENLAHEME